MRPRSDMPRGRLSIGQTLLLLLGARIALELTIYLGVLLRQVSRGISVEEAARELTSDPFGPGLAQVIALGLAIFVGVRIAHREERLREALHIAPIAPAVAALAMVAGLCSHFCLVELSAILSDLFPPLALDDETIRGIERMTRIDGPVRAITVPLAVVVIAPLTEELLFRGLLLPALRAQLGTAGAIAVTGLLFGIFHVLPLVVVYAAIAGVVLGAIFVRTRSVLAPIAFHAAFNSVPLLLPAELVAIPGLNGQDGEHLPVALVASGAIGAALSLALLWRATASPPPEPPPPEPPAA
jgi:membrane protease YdiL (CAAX protease family)